MIGERVQGRVARRAFRGIAELQYVLCGVLRRQVKHFHGVRLDGTDAAAGSELAGFRLVEEVDGRTDALAATDMDAAAMLDAVRRFVVLTVQVIFGFIDEEKSFLVDVHPGSGDRRQEFADRGGRAELGFDDARATLDLDKHDGSRHSSYPL